VTEVLIAVLVFLGVAWGAWARERRLVRACQQAERRAIQAEYDREQAIRQRDMHERRANEFFEIIQGVEGEAQTWRRMYQQGMAGAGAAQSWLFRDLSEVVKLANAYGARLRKLGEKAPPVQVNPQLKRFIDDFEEHTKAEVPRAPGHEEAERLEREVRGPAALNEPIEAQPETNDQA
jgi:hypothetical protein